MTTTSPYRFGGRSAILSAALAGTVLLLLLLMGVPPADPEELLRYLSPVTTPWAVVVGLSAVAALLVLPFAYAMYRALADVGGNLALAGCGLLAVFAVLDLAVRWPSYAALITLAGPWADATTTELEVLVGSAGHATATLQSFLMPIYVTLIPGIGILLVSAAWYRAELGRFVAYLGIVVALLAVLTIVAGTFTPLLSVLTMATSAAIALWLAVTGYALLRRENSRDLKEDA